MSLGPGQRLGPYEVLAPIGAGGMGEVYRARDTRLERTVAVKVLPAHLAGQADARQRFEREARAVSSLNHPHICTLHDIGQQEGVDFLVMEYLEGETLADCLKKGALPLDRALCYAIEIADALHKAHRQGVIHRDLKPGNVMLTRSGTKLLDFGLAKLQETPSDAPGELSLLQTEQRSLTSAGAILGTFQYMAPEQLEGKEADARTDIFALGAVLYEMVTGRRAFEGKSQAGLVAAILEREPPSIASLQPDAPPALHHVLRKCLAKDPEQRWQTAHDVMLELQWIAEGGSQPAAAPAISAARRVREPLGWVVAAVLLVGLLLLAVPALRRADLPRPVRSSILPPDKTSFGDSLAVSPDGLRVAFVAAEAQGATRLWIRALDSLEAQALPGTESAALPFWSPDSRSIGFFAQNKLRRIDISGGPPQILADVSLEPRGGTWNQDGVILFSPGFTDPIYRISATGGDATPLTQLDASRTETSHRWPHFLPDGRRFLYHARCLQANNNAVLLTSLDAKESKVVLPVETSVAYAPPGYLFFAREQSLMVQPFNLGKLQLSGDPVRMAEGIIHFGESGPTAYAPFSVSGNGVLAYRTGSELTTQLSWFDRNGKPLETVGSPGGYGHLSLAPGARQLALVNGTSRSAGDDVWLMDLSRGALTRFTFSPDNDYAPLWSPDGSQIVYSSDRQGRSQLYRKAASGAGSEELLLESPSNLAADDWSPDGRLIIYETTNAKLKSDLWILPLSGDRKPKPFLQTEFSEERARLSPDGRWVAYVSDESGKNEVYVRSFPAAEGKWQVSTSGGTEPVWRSDGKELCYLALDRTIMSVEVKAGSAFEAGVSKPLFSIRVRDIGVGASTRDRNFYAAAPDGRFLVNNVVGEHASSPITLVLNWSSLLAH